MPRIHVKEPNHYYTFELPVTPGSEVVVGTAPSCKLSLPGVQGLAPAHARIVCQGNGYVIEDLQQSPLGTQRNGQPIRAEYMAPGTEYQLAAVTIVLEPEAVAQPVQPEQQPAPQQPVQPQPAAPQSSAKPAKSSKGPVLRTAADAGDTPAQPGGAIDDLVKKYDRTGSRSKATVIYVIIILLLAFYAGIALRHWERTGNYLPGIKADG